MWKSKKIRSVDIFIYLDIEYQFLKYYVLVFSDMSILISSEISQQFTGYKYVKKKIEKNVKKEKA